MIYIGIDNGLTGGLVALNPSPDRPLGRIAMPTKAKSKGNEVDAQAVAAWLRLWTAEFDVTVILETPGKFAKGVQAVASMWDSYGCIRGILESLEIRHHRIAPQTWQKALLVGCAKGDTKPAALSRARQLWPAESWLATARSTKPHEGLIDAALIAEYGRLKNV